MTPAKEHRPPCALARSRDSHHTAYRDVVERQFGAWDMGRHDEFFARSGDTAIHELAASSERRANGRVAKARCQRPA